MPGTSPFGRYLGDGRESFTPRGGGGGGAGGGATWRGWGSGGGGVGGGGGMEEGVSGVLETGGKGGGGGSTFSGVLLSVCCGLGVCLAGDMRVGEKLIPLEAM